MKRKDVRAFFKTVLKRRAKPREGQAVEVLADVIELMGAYWVLEMTQALTRARPSSAALPLHQPAVNVHTCPYKEEINNDHDSTCECTPEEERECRNDI